MHYMVSSRRSSRHSHNLLAVGDGMSDTLAGFATGCVFGSLLTLIIILVNYGG